MSSMSSVLKREHLELLMASRRNAKNYYTSRVLANYLNRIGKLNTMFNGNKLSFISFDEYYNNLEHSLYQNNLYLAFTALDRLWYTKSMLERTGAPNVC